MKQSIQIQLHKRIGTGEAWDIFFDGVYVVSCVGTVEEARAIANDGARLALDAVNSTGIPLSEMMARLRPAASASNNATTDRQIGFALVPGSKEIN